MTSLFHRNPRLLALTLIFTLAAGLSAYFTLPRMENPKLVDRFATVVTLFPGADAERVEALVTEKIEEELQEIEEVGLLQSTSRAGVSIVKVELDDRVVDVQPVWPRIRSAIDDAEDLFPEGVGTPDFDVMSVQAFTLITGLRWDAAGEPNEALLSRLAEELEDVLRAVPGTEETELFGAAREEVRVSVDPARIAAIGLGAGDVARRIAAADSKVAAGQVRGDGADLVVEVDGEIDSLARVGEVPLAMAPEGGIVRVSDVATITKTVMEPRAEITLIDGDCGVAVAARMAVSHRVDVWAAQAHEALDGFRADLPRGVALATIFDQSGYTERRLSDLFQNLIVGAGLVVLVTFFMMGWRRALVVGTALPLTSLMVLAGMQILGVPMHQFSITGLIIALGLLIDNAIVAVDDVGHRRAEGLSAVGAIDKTVRTLAVPLIGSTITTALAFAPILLMPGNAGEFVGALAISVILAIVASLFLSLTVLPSLAVRLDPEPTHGRSWWHDGVTLPSVTALYRGVLGWGARRPLAGIAFALFLPTVGFVAAQGLVEQFFPPAERDQFHVELRLPQGASIEATRTAALRASEVLQEEPRIGAVHWFVGNAAPKFYYNVTPTEDGTPSYAQAIVQLDDAADGARLIREAQARLDAGLPSAQLMARQLEQGPPFDAPIEIRILGPDIDRLQELGDGVRAMVAAVPGVEHVRTTLVHGRAKLHVALDDEEARRAGLTNRDIAAQLDARLEGAFGGSFLEATEELPVRVRVGDADRGDPSVLADAQLSSRGRWTPLSAVADLHVEPEPASIPRRDGARVNTIQGFTTAGTLPEEARREVEARLAAADFTLPPGYRLEFGGEAAERDDAVGKMLSSVALLLVLMAGSLVLSFNSFRLAGVIGAVGGLSLGLALGALWLFGYPFGFMAIVGSMGLVGVAINDSIVVLAALRDDALAAAGHPDAVRDVVVRSTRHVLATSITTMAGFTPLILAGGLFWPPVAVTIGAGVAGATVIALVFVPSAFLLLRGGLRPALAGA